MMPVRKESTHSSETSNPYSTLRVSGLFIRRKADREFHSYIPLLAYHPGDYEVLLRQWGSEPFPSHLGAFSGPMIAGLDPEEILLEKSSSWIKTLANKAGIKDSKTFKGHKAVFMSLHGGGKQVDPISRQRVKIGIVLCYVVPIRQRDSSVFSQFPSSSDYPNFYNFGDILHKMVRSDCKIHPYTREMLSSLDHWLREQHSVPGGINTLFAPSLQSRMKMFVTNPSFAQSQSNAEAALETPEQSFTDEVKPLLSSTPFNGLNKSRATRGERTNSIDSQPADMIVKNPLFGSGLRLKLADMIVTNDYFGCGEPKYSALGETKGKWMVQVQGDGLPDWTELFPLHKFSCEGNAVGVRMCIQKGISADERDTDSWSPLHYACWYGELQVVKILVEEASAKIGIQNNSGSTPLHLAAGTGHAAVVSYLLEQREGRAVKAALDNDGKSPLAVCLECKMNDWKITAQVLRDAYKNLTQTELSFPPPLLPYSPEPSSMEDNPLQLINKVQQLKEKEKDLGLKGSLGDLDSFTDGKSPPKKAKQKSKAQGKKPARTIRRQRVNLGIGQHQMAHFFNGRETSCKDVILNLYRLIKLPKNFYGLFALWLSSDSLEFQLGDTDQPLKLMYSWKTLLSRYGSGKGEAEIPSFHLWRNVFAPPLVEKTVTDSIILEYLYTDAHRHIINSHYPCSEEELFFLAGITLQITYGDYNEAVHRSGFLREKLNRLLPSHMIASRRKVEFERKILTKYSEVSQFGFDDIKFLYQMYLKCCWKWPYYGATFYQGILHMKEAKLELNGKIMRKSQLSVNIGINVDGFHLVNTEANALLISIPFDGLDWDVSTAKHELVIFNKDHSIYIPIHSRKASLLYSLATRMREQYEAAK